MTQPSRQDDSSPAASTPRGASATSSTRHEPARFPATTGRATPARRTSSRRSRRARGRRRAALRRAARGGAACATSAMVALRRAPLHRRQSSPIADVGSTALARPRVRRDRAHRARPARTRSLVPELTAFLRAQQRPDGEFMHRYDRARERTRSTCSSSTTRARPRSRSRARTRCSAIARDLDAATRGLAHLVGPAWSFFGSRYYFGEEHWTCQAMDDLWDRAPRPAGARLLPRLAGVRAQARCTATGDTPFDADGAYGVGPVVTPRLTPVGEPLRGGHRDARRGQAGARDRGGGRARPARWRR